MGVERKWIDWIDWCISTISFSVLTNGSPTLFFKSTFCCLTCMQQTSKTRVDLKTDNTLNAINFYVEEVETHGHCLVYVFYNCSRF